MSFFTTLNCYRPTSPPPVTGHSLADFILAFSKLRVARPDGPMTLNVKFGNAIDQDNCPSHWDEPISELVSVSKEIDWDLDIKCPSLRSMCEHLVGKWDCVYRAHIGLGAATRTVFRHVSRIGSPENEVDLALDGWSLEIGPILSADLSAAELFCVGWISIALSGNGYLWPWTFADLVERAQSLAATQRVMNLCKQTWPVAAQRPNRQAQKLRRQMGGLWPYPKIDLPWDWYWGISESG